jgi:hypothetical protein
MTNEEKLKANLAAAKMLGLVARYDDIEGSVVTDCACMYRTFDIFNNPADQLAVVQELCERGITIRKQARNDYRIARRTSMSRKGRRSYAEAAAAAVLEVAG